MTSYNINNNIDLNKHLEENHAGEKAIYVKNIIYESIPIYEEMAKFKIY